jgi:transcriptional activator of glycolytic enzymes GCR1
MEQALAGQVEELRHGLLERALPDFAAQMVIDPTGSAPLAAGWGDGHDDSGDGHGNCPDRQDAWERVVCAGEHSIWASSHLHSSHGTDPHPSTPSNGWPRLHFLPFSSPRPLGSFRPSFGFSRLAPSAPRPPARSGPEPFSLPPLPPAGVCDVPHRPNCGAILAGMDGSGVQQLVSTYGPRWRPQLKERTFYSRRKAIIDKIRKATSGRDVGWVI